MADEYIKREDAIDTLKQTGIIVDNELGNLVVDEMNRIPAADVQKVVICAECRYYSEKRRECGHINGLSEIVFPTDYCSYGSKPMMDGEG